MTIAATERLARAETQITEHDGTIRDHETRVRKLERSYWRLSGIIAVGSTGGGLLSGIATALAVHYLEKP
jgi:hypothetical protein